MQPCRLEEHLVKQAGNVDNPRNIVVTDKGELLVNPRARTKGTFRQSVITDVGGAAKGSIDRDDKGICVNLIYFVDCFLQVFGMHRFLQRAVNIIGGIAEDRVESVAEQWA